MEQKRKLRFIMHDKVKKLMEGTGELKERYFVLKGIYDQVPFIKATIINNKIIELDPVRKVVLNKINLQGIINHLQEFCNIMEDWSNNES